MAELELGIGQDNAALLGSCGGLGVDLQGSVLELFSQLLSHHAGYLLQGDVFVMLAQLCLGGRGEDGGGQLARLHESGGQRHTTHMLRGVVVDKARARQIATCHTFHGHHVQFLADHGAAEHLFGDALIFRATGQVVGKVEHVEEVEAHGGEHPTLIGNWGAEDPVVGGDAVGGDHQQSVAIDFVELADFTRGKMLVIGKLRTHSVSLVFGIRGQKGVRGSRQVGRWLPWGSGSPTRQPWR